MTFEDIILAIVQENSGGVKMTKLVTEIVTAACELSQAGKAVEEFDELRIIAKDGSGDYMSPFLDALDRKLEEMEAAGKIGLLHYGWNMGRRVVRIKTFIYSPLEPGETP